MTTVPLIVEAIFRFIPSALVVYLFIDVNLTSRFNKSYNGRASAFYIWLRD